jgi:hypothetical protein
MREVTLCFKDFVGAEPDYFNEMACRMVLENASHWKTRDLTRPELLQTVQKNPIPAF